MTLVIAMIASATIVAATYNKKELVVTVEEEILEIESSLIGSWQYNYIPGVDPSGSNIYYILRFNEDGTYSRVGMSNDEPINQEGIWHVDQETGLLFMKSKLNDFYSRGVNFALSIDGKVLTLSPEMRKARPHKKIIIEVSESQPIPQPIIPQPIPKPIPSDIIVMSLGDTFHPGSVSGNCMMVGQIHYRCLCVSLELYIDGELHSIQDKTTRSIWFEGTAYSGYLFDNWDTTKYENGLHELKITNSNGNVVVEMLVLVQN